MSEKLLAVAGYMGSGKSTASHFFSRMGITVITVDELAKELLSTDKCIQSQLSVFYPDAIDQEGRIEFELLGRHVFSSNDILIQYNQIVHPPLVQELRKRLDESSCSNIVVDAALVSYWGIESWFDACLWIQSCSNLRFHRLKSLSHKEPHELQQRIDLQSSLFPEPNGDRWTVISNNGTVQEFQNKLCTFFTHFIDRDGISLQRD